MDVWAVITLPFVSYVLGDKKNSTFFLVCGQYQPESWCLCFCIFGKNVFLIRITH